jgi:hypothetical protein
MVGGSLRVLRLLLSEFIQRFPKKNEKELARSFNFTFRYIYDILSPNNSRFGFDLIITKTGRHDIAEIFLKVALKYQKKIKSNPNLELFGERISYI